MTMAKEVFIFQIGYSYTYEFSKYTADMLHVSSDTSVNLYNVNWQHYIVSCMQNLNILEVSIANK